MYREEVYREAVRGPILPGWYTGPAPPWVYRPCSSSSSCSCSVPGLSLSFLPVTRRPSLPPHPLAIRQVTRISSGPPSSGRERDLGRFSLREEKNSGFRQKYAVRRLPDGQ